MEPPLPPPFLLCCSSSSSVSTTLPRLAAYRSARLAALVIVSSLSSSTTSSSFSSLSSSESKLRPSSSSSSSSYFDSRRAMRTDLMPSESGNTTSSIQLTFLGSIPFFSLRFNLIYHVTSFLRRWKLIAAKQPNHIVQHRRIIFFYRTCLIDIIFVPLTCPIRSNMECLSQYFSIIHHTLLIVTIDVLLPLYVPNTIAFACTIG